MRLKHIFFFKKKKKLYKNMGGKYFLGKYGFSPEVRKLEENVNTESLKPPAGLSPQPQTVACETVSKMLCGGLTAAVVLSRLGPRLSPPRWCCPVPCLPNMASFVWPYREIFCPARHLSLGCLGHIRRVFLQGLCTHLLHLSSLFHWTSITLVLPL